MGSRMCGPSISLSGGRGPNGWSIRVRVNILHKYTDHQRLFNSQFLYSSYTTCSYFSVGVPIKPKPLPLSPMHPHCPMPHFSQAFPSLGKGVSPHKQGLCCFVSSVPQWDAPKPPEQVVQQFFITEVTWWLAPMFPSKQWGTGRGAGGARGIAVCISDRL